MKIYNNLRIISCVLLALFMCTANLACKARRSGINGKNQKNGWDKPDEGNRNNNRPDINQTNTNQNTTNRPKTEPIKEKTALEKEFDTISESFKKKEPKKFEEEITKVIDKNLSKKELEGFLSQGTSYLGGDKDKYKPENQNGGPLHMLAKMDDDKTANRLLEKFIDRVSNEFDFDRGGGLLDKKDKDGNTTLSLLLEKEIEKPDSDRAKNIIKLIKAGAYLKVMPTDYKKNLVDQAINLIKNEDESILALVGKELIIETLHTSRDNFMHITVWTNLLAKNYNENKNSGAKIEDVFQNFSSLYEYLDEKRKNVALYFLFRTFKGSNDENKMKEQISYLQDLIKFASSFKNNSLKAFPFGESFIQEIIKNPPQNLAKKEYIESICQSYKKYIFETESDAHNIEWNEYISKKENAFYNKHIKTHEEISTIDLIMKLSGNIDENTAKSWCYFN